MENKTLSIKSIYGILFQILSVSLFTLMVVTTRYLYKTTTYNPIEILVWRSVPLVTLNIIISNRNSIDIINIKQKDSKIVFYRSIAGVLGIIGFFFTNYLLPPSIGTAIIKLNPLITNIAAIVIANERVSNIEVFGMIIAFGGVLMIIFDPSKVAFSLSSYLSQIYLFTIPLLTAVVQSIAIVLIRMMGQSLHYIISPTYLGMSTIILGFPLVLGALSLRGYVTQFTMFNTFLLSLVGLFGWAGQITSSRALQLEKAARLTAINFDTVLLLLIDIFYFGETISLIEIFGITLIMFTVVGIATLKILQLVN